MTQETVIQKGKVLLAEPFMADPNFKRAVVLLCEHEQNGSLGFILNKSLDMPVCDLIADFPEFEGEAYYGGPVQTDTIHYIHNVGDLLEGSQMISQGVYWGGDFEKLKFLIRTRLVDVTNIRFFVGYSGWTPGQLAEEMEFKSWILADMDANYAFKRNERLLWQEILEQKGDAYSVLAQIPDSLHWN
ncbi:MAG: YqgE/AlgH family protein [Saprospiraceae bacterium]|jgi:putative transcriptional regulator